MQILSQVSSAILYGSETMPVEVENLITLKPNKMRQCLQNRSVQWFRHLERMEDSV